MSIGLARIPISEFVRRMVERTGRGNWFALIVPKGEVSQLAEQIAKSITGELGVAVASIKHPETADNISAEVGRHTIIVVSNVDDWPTVEWARLDVLRSRLLSGRTVAFVLSNLAASRLFAGAPHFARFFGGSVWEVELDADLMTESERLSRIKSLETWAKMSTSEMMTKAEKRELSSDPQYAEWLALAGGSKFL